MGSFSVIDRHFTHLNNDNIFADKVFVIHITSKTEEVTLKMTNLKDMLTFGYTLAVLFTVSNT